MIENLISRAMMPGGFNFTQISISPYKELLAYEYLWAKPKSSLKNIAKQLSKKNILPSEIVAKEGNTLFTDAATQTDEIKTYIDQKIRTGPYFSVLLKESPQYPEKLLDAKHPIDLFYYRGNPDIINKKTISIVGTRKISSEGIKRTQQLVRKLAQYDVAVVSGLARGTDTVALAAAIGYGLPVIGVIGTPIDRYYPKENRDLQERIATEYLLMSQVPFYKYEKQAFSSKKIYFVERDATMAAISDATIIVEASDASGTLFQARACIEQGRKLFILNSCFENPHIKWPAEYEKKGALRVRFIQDILDNIGGAINFGKKMDAV
ncbi:MAG: DNA-protecting protein DprA [Spirochaetaceae bacterium]|jgi:DNA processing protein|nr:DNA-protecting protein DprA [Spirochaetaceae bacterium]